MGNIILNITFVIMISFFSISINSKLFIKAPSQKNNLNITLDQGNLTIKDSNFTFSAENLNSSLAKDLLNDMKKKDKKYAEFIHPDLTKISSDLKNGDVPKFRLPKFMNKSPVYIGNGNYIYTNLTNGHSLTIHLFNTNNTSTTDPIKQINKKIQNKFEKSAVLKNSSTSNNKNLVPSLPKNSFLEISTDSTLQINKKIQNKSEKSVTLKKSTTLNEKILEQSLPLQSFLEID